uniref:Autophagy-related protein n=1 Tax=viral metagenome TaxID=1070528 RepID=A0A6C0JF82_9ZZZZ|tara:strand:- start:469 stop:876 length:408 start_codon:yes stop_codon:yes gene_type:complete
MDLLLRTKRAYQRREQNKKISKSEFKSKHILIDRQGESRRILEKYPDRIPVICERISRNIPQVDRRKYLCPGDLSLSNFMHVLRKRIKLEPEKALYLFINNKLVPCSSVLATLYDKEKSEDGFLYINYAGESTFG